MLNSPAPGRGRLPTAQQQLDQALQARPQARQRIVDDPRLLPLLQRVAAGDRVALAAVYDLLAPQVLALVRLLLDAKGDGDAVERVVVETFCQVWRQAPPMAERHPNGAAWVLAVAVECAQRDRRSRPSCI